MYRTPFSHRVSILALACVVALLTGCGGLQLDEQAPPQFELNGVWRLDPLVSDQTPDGRTVGEGPAPQVSRRSRRSHYASSLAFIAHDFPVLATREMKIEQNADSMGVRYDNGRYRDVSWGERDRGPWEVYAGWKDGVLMVVSKAGDLDVVETYTLSGAGRVLTVDVDATGGGGDIQATRVFKR